MYDFAHPIEDAIEGVTHSLCSLEFEDHRPLYDWVINNTSVKSKPRQIEFARLGINHTVMSKRKLRLLVEEGHVGGWDDPRMPTLCGLRRRGYTPRAIRNFATVSVFPRSTVPWNTAFGALPAGRPERNGKTRYGCAASGKACNYQLPRR